MLYAEVYETYIVSATVSGDGVVLVKNTNQKISLKKEDFDQFIIVDAKGETIYVEDFTEGMVLLIAQSDAGAGKKAVKVLVSEQKVSGIVTAVYTNDAGKTVIDLDGINKYVLSDGVTSPKLNQGVVVTIDMMGKVAWIDYSNTGEFMYGIITSVKYRRKTGSVVVKMVTAKETIEEFDVQGKLIVDRTSYKDMQSLYDVLHNEDNITVGNYRFPAGVYPVRYKLKSDGTLAEIDTPNTVEDANTLELVDTGKYTEKGGIMGGLFAIKDSTPVFRVSGTASADGIVKPEFFDDIYYHG